MSEAKLYHTRLLLPLILVAALLSVTQCSRGVKTEVSGTETSEKTTDKDRVPGDRGEDKQAETVNPLAYTGSFRLTVSGFTGSLVLGYADGVYTGTIRFDGWGNNNPQPLKDLRINNGKIYFVRSVSTADEMKKYGATRFFSQTYRGDFSPDGRQIKGEYNESGTESRWEASR
jgi:hypothetical protein